MENSKNPISKFLKDNGLTQAQLKDECSFKKLSQATISRFINKANVSTPNLFLLSKATGISCDELAEFSFNKFNAE